MGYVEEPSRDRNVRVDNKRTRIRNAFATIANPVRKEYMGTTPKYYRFVSTVFTPLLVIGGYKVEIEWYTFDIDLIPFGSGSFDVIIGMDWLP
ncbi:hypothetical protein Tco_0518148 [Tanacetum coccineum]